MVFVIGLFGTSFQLDTAIDLLLLAFMAILFLQSGLDKVFDYKGNLGYINSVFEKTPLRGVSPVLFLTITILEVAAGALCLLGAGQILLTGDRQLAVSGMFLSAVSLLSLFFGQRIAKDYAGAASLVSYFIVAIMGLVVLGCEG